MSKLELELFLTSFGYSNGRPKTSNKDMIISVKNMINVPKTIRDKHNGTSEELQKALLNIESNKEQYNSILNNLKVKVEEMINNSKNEAINIYIGCEAGKHRSVAVVSMLEKDLASIVKDINISFDICHRDLSDDGERKKKSTIMKDRSKERDSKRKFINNEDDF